MEEQYLELSPPELKFRFELRKSIPVTLTLKNPGSERIAFKVKTTSPKKYCVRPSSGYVEPGTTKEVQVILQAQREQPQFLGDCKDKFLIQTVPINSEIRWATGRQACCFLLLCAPACEALAGEAEPVLSKVPGT